MAVTNDVTGVVDSGLALLNNINCKVFNTMINNFNTALCIVF